MNYAEKISRRYGCSIPAEYLIKAIRYRQPRPGIVTGNLFLSWGQLTDKLPEPDFRVVTSAIGHGDRDFAFAHWLLIGQKDEVLVRLRPMHTIYRARGFQKLRRIAARGYDTLNRLDARRFYAASAIGKQMAQALARSIVTLDPDRS